MVMIVESRIVIAAEQTNEILVQVLAEVRRTHQLLEWLGQVVGSAGAVQPAAPTNP
jgi:hypothetical protein